MTTRTVGSLITQHLHQDDTGRQIAATYVGQAHIAGTGPAGKTCRECALWGIFKGAEGRIIPPKFHPVTGQHKGALKLGRCHKPIVNKTSNPFPHDAAACRHFEQNPEPPAPQKAPPPAKAPKAPKQKAKPKGTKGRKAKRK